MFCCSQGTSYCCSTFEFVELEYAYLIELLHFCWLLYTAVLYCHECCLCAHQAPCQVLLLLQCLYTASNSSTLVEQRRTILLCTLLLLCAANNTDLQTFKIQNSKSTPLRYVLVGFLSPQTPQTPHARVVCSMLNVARDTRAIGTGKRKPQTTRHYYRNNTA